MSRTAVIVVVAAVAALVFAGAARAETITLYGNSEEPPKAWLDGGTTPKGFAIEASVEVLKRAGYDVTVSLLPFARALQKTAEGGVMTGVAFSAERARLYKFSDALPAILDDDIVVVVNKGKEFPFQKASDLSGKRIGVQSSFFYGDDFAAAMPQMLVDGDSSPNLRMKKLSAGRVDAVLVGPGRAAFFYSVKEADLSPEDFTVLPKPLARLSNHLIVGRNVPEGDTTLARINKAIAELTQDGTIAKLMARYDE